MTPPVVRDRVFVVLGLGRSGCAAGALLRRHGAHVIGVDDAELTAVHAGWARNDLASTAEAGFDDLVTGPDWHTRLKTSPDGVVLSPGVPAEHVGLDSWRRQHVPIHGELEWAARFLRGRAIAVTGTNGKSTTTAWIAHVLGKAGLDSPALGNLGTPLANRVDELDPSSVPVVECSSFQLETIAEWRPTVGLVLNLAPDHLDRYATLADYYAAKARLAARIADDGWFVTWTGCEEARAWSHKGRRVLFGDADPETMSWLEGDDLMIARGNGVHRLISLGDLWLQSPPNVLNALATVAAAAPFVDDLDALAAGLVGFRGLAHRHELVGRLGGIRFINDTKATNVHAVQAGLQGYPRPVVVIMGGRGKGEDYAPLRDVMAPVRHVVTIGEEGPAIAAALAGSVATLPAATLENAVAIATDLAQPEGDVLLSPACASFDMFASYRDRGAAFAAAARALGAEEE